MSRKPNIRWRKSDAERLNKEIERFNNKIYRVRHNNPELKGILPDTIKKGDKMKMIEEFKKSPRSEFNKKINSLDRFVRPGAEKPIRADTGNTVTQWEKKEVGLKVAQVNRARTMERKKYDNMPVTSRGESVGMKRGEMGSVRMNSLRAKTFNFDKIRGGKEWEKFKASIDKLNSPSEKAERLEFYKKNYIKGLENAFGDYSKDIVNILNDLPADVVVDTFYSEQEATIDFFYEPQEMNLKLDMLNSIWAKVGKEYNAVNG